MNDPITFQKFIEWCFMGLIAGGIGWTAIILRDISNSLVEIRIQIASILERVSWHEKDIIDHDKRLKHLENTDVTEYDS